MKKYFFLSLLLAIRCATAQDAPAVDTKTMLAALKEIKVKHTEAAKTQYSKLMQELSSAASSNNSAIAYYMEAMRALSFTGKSHEQTLFQDWKKKEAEHLKSPEMQTAMRLHLAYLILTLQRANGFTVPQLLPGLLRYSEQVTSASNDVVRQQIMKDDVTGSIFVKWRGNGQMFESLDAWETRPGNVDGMWLKTILPQFRKDKDPRVIVYWDNKIKSGVEVMSETDKAFDVTQFNAVYKPELLWSRALDMIAIGLRNRGMGEMYAIVKNWPDHPRNAEWITKLEDVLSGKDLIVTGTN